MFALYAHKSEKLIKTDKICNFLQNTRTLQPTQIANYSLFNKHNINAKVSSRQLNHSAAHATTLSECSFIFK